MTSDARSDKTWKPLARALLIVGLAGLAVVPVMFTFLMIYYSAVRPHSPQPSVGWTARLQHTAGAYGTESENARLVGLFFGTQPIATLAALGGAITTYKLGWDPRRK